MLLYVVVSSYMSLLCILDVHVLVYVGNVYCIVCYCALLRFVVLAVVI